MEALNKAQREIIKPLYKEYKRRSRKNVSHDTARCFSRDSELIKQIPGNELINLEYSGALEHFLDNWFITDPAIALMEAADDNGFQTVLGLFDKVFSFVRSFIP